MNSRSGGGGSGGLQRRETFYAGLQGNTGGEGETLDPRGAAGTLQRVSD